MQLYYHPISTYSQKVLIALYEKGLDFDSEIVQLMDPEKNAEYREIYPMGKVPMLKDDDHMIPESSIIIEYIDDMADPRLISGDANATRQIRFKDRMFDLYLNEAVVTILFQNMKPEEQRDAERIETAWHRINTMYMFMESEFGEQDYANGDEFLMGDCAAAPALFYAQKVAPFSEHKNIVAYWDRLNARPSVQRVFEEAAPYVEAFEKQNAA